MEKNMGTTITDESLGNGKENASYKIMDLQGLYTHPVHHFLQTISRYSQPSTPNLNTSALYCRISCANEPCRAEEFGLIWETPI